MNDGSLSPVFPSRKERRQLRYLQGNQDFNSSTSGKTFDHNPSAFSCKSVITPFSKNEEPHQNEINEFHPLNSSLNDQMMSCKSKVPIYGKDTVSSSNAVNYSSALDDSFMTCDIDSIIIPGNVSKNHVQLPEKNCIKTDSCSSGNKVHKCTTNRNSKKQKESLETYISPGKFEIKVRKGSRAFTSGGKNAKRLRYDSPKQKNTRIKLDQYQEADLFTDESLISKNKLKEDTSIPGQSIPKSRISSDHHNSLRPPESCFSIAEKKSICCVKSSMPKSSLKAGGATVNDDCNLSILNDPETMKMLEQSFCSDFQLNQSRLRSPSPDLFSDAQTNSSSSQKLEDFTLSQQQAVDNLADKENHYLKNSEDTSGKSTKSKQSMTEQDNCFEKNTSSELELISTSTSEDIITDRNMTSTVSPPATCYQKFPQDKSPSDNFCSTLLPKSSQFSVRLPGGQSSQVSSIGSESVDSQNLMLQMVRNMTNTQKTVNSSCTQATLDTSSLRRSEVVQSAITKIEKVQTEGSVGYEMGPFFGLPTAVRDIIETHRGIKQLYDWQAECIEKGVPGNNLLISLPTSGGKTLVAEILMLRTLLIHKKHAIFLLPYVAIVQEKVRGLSPLAVEMGFLLEEYAGSRGSYPPKQRIKKNVAFIATIEKANGLLNSFLEEGRAHELGLLVVDEAHMLGEGGGRGALLESLITKLKFAASHVQVVAMSATISNLQQLANFMQADLYTGQFRPVQLKQYVKFQDQIAEINPAALADEDILTNYSPVKFNEEKNLDQDGIAALVKEVIPYHSVLVFCSTRRNCESVAMLLATLLPSSMKQLKINDKKALYAALSKEGNGTVCPVLRKVIPYGISYHHSGLTEGERKLVEEGYLTGTLCVITCTSTLAAGINLPARRVILRSPYTGLSPLTRSRYTQMVGRAGRAGLDSCGESFLIMQPRDMGMIPSLVRGPVEKCISKLCSPPEENPTPFSHATAVKVFPLSPPTVEGNNISAGQELVKNSGLRDLIFSSIGLSLVKTPAEVKELVKCSLLALQAQQLGLDVEKKVDDILSMLRECGMLRIKEGISEQEKEDVASVLKVPLQPHHVLGVSRLGRAAVKGCVELSISQRLYEDLLVARNSLAVHSRLHLLYLVTPYTAAQEITMNPQAFYDAFSALNEAELKVAQLIGITEPVVSRVVMNRIKAAEMDIIKRFHAAIIIHRLTSGDNIWSVAEKFEVPRGLLQRTMTAAAAFASCVHHFCRELEELWAFKDLLASFSRQLQNCCSANLLPLMDLPAVKLGRARLLFASGYTSLTAVANADPRELSRVLHHLPLKSARQMVLSAKALLLEKAESLQEEAEQMLLGISGSTSVTSAGGSGFEHNSGPSTV